MSKKSSRKPNNTGFLRQQAEQQRKAQAAKLARKTEQTANEEQAKEFLGKLVKQVVEQQGKINRLAVAFADRCWRVHELYQSLKAEYERAEAAEARVRELEAAAASRNGHPPAKPPAKKATRRAT